MKTYFTLGAISVLAAVALQKARFVTVAGTVPAAGDYCPGVANESYAAGEQAGVVTHGCPLVEAGAALAAGAAVQADSLGRVVTLAGGVSLGRALDAASAAGELVRVKLA